MANLEIRPDFLEKSGESGAKIPDDGLAYVGFNGKWMRPDECINSGYKFNILGNIASFYGIDIGFVVNRYNYQLVEIFGSIYGVDMLSSEFLRIDNASDYNPSFSGDAFVYLINMADSIHIFSIVIHNNIL